MKPIVVGAHYGLKDWLAQRLTAVAMAAYTLLWLGIAGYAGGVDYALWRSLFANTAFRVATLLFGLAVLWHAWVGMRDIWMDYIKPVGLRLALDIFTIAWLVGCAGWALQVLWRI